MTRQIRILWKVIVAFAIVSFVLEVLGVSGYSFVWKYISTAQFTLVSSMYLAVSVAVLVFGLGTLFALIGTRGKMQEYMAASDNGTLVYWRKKRLRYMIGWWALLGVVYLVFLSIGLYLGHGLKIIDPVRLLQTA